MEHNQEQATQKVVKKSSGLKNKFSNLNVGTKVTLGSGIILIFLICVAVVAHFGLYQADKNFKDYRALALQTNQMGRIQANLLEARLNSKDFILKNTDEAAEKVSDRIAATSLYINEGQGLFTRQDAKDIMSGASVAIATYQKSFADVTELVKQRNVLVDQLNALGPQAEKNLTQIMDSAFKDQDPAASHAAGSALRSLLLARLYANRFLVDNEAASSERAISELDQFNQLSEKMFNELQNPTRRELAESTVNISGEYRSAFDQVVVIINERNGIITGTLDKIGPRLARQMEDLKLENKAFQDELGPRATAEMNFAVKATDYTSIAIVLFGLALSFFIGRLIASPIVKITDSMRQLADGDLDVDIPALGQKDEIGKMADTLLVFQEAAVEKQKLQEQKAQEDANRAEKEREIREREKAEAKREISVVVDQLGQNLKSLADGDLTLEIKEQFPDEFDALRVDFNNSIIKINGALSKIATNTQSIEGNSVEMKSSADDLARRTEQQASSLEETSAALEEITATVQETSTRATEAAERANQAKADTDKSSEVVGNAVQAMEGIEKASADISNIINVIDEIAFQTNLLALNAGVEAARAGEAGKGFAVVAQEVRELAQRSADAAKQIKELISKSSSEVESGVALVKATGESLEQISDHVTNINEQIATIARAASEQLDGVRNVNSAVSQMDQMTQQNAAMVEESTALAHQTAEDVDHLSEMVGGFSLKPVMPRETRAA
ncbi:MAG: methyl-accepting chemotaxis protein [Rhizobiaceae bacterium]|nr:methyl-accepting chemotaxis protein [Rhizobiaceae bacterium]